MKAIRRVKQWAKGHFLTAEGVVARVIETPSDVYNALQLTASHGQLLL